MRTRPDDLPDAALAGALRAWEIEAVALDYAAVGFGDHHWHVRGADGRRWFLTVAEPAAKAHLGAGCGLAGAKADESEGVAADESGAFAALRQAMDCARALRDGGFAAAVAPERTVAGETVVALGGRYAVSVFARVDGDAGRFGDEPGPAARRATIALLAELHAVPAPEVTPAIAWDPPARDALEGALASLGEPWDGGRYAEPARVAVRAAAPGVRAALVRFDAQVAALASAPPPLVVTHGEPHPGNLLVERHASGDSMLAERASDDRDRADASDHTGRLRLVDWDTVGLSVPERDLWHVVRDDGDLDLYERLSGRRPRADLLDLFRLRWHLGDAGELLGWFRAPHRDGDDLADGWRELQGLLARLGRAAGRAGAG
jgi:spectinomycin phosphotransferase